jgi:hypothetical protein
LSPSTPFLILLSEQSSESSVITQLVVPFTPVLKTFHGFSLTRV